MKVFFFVLVLACSAAWATEQETTNNEEQTSEAHTAQSGEQVERVKLETIKITPTREPASWGGRNIR
jgi:hypothetical protein